MKRVINNKTKIGNHQLHPETLMMSYGYDPTLSENSVKPPVFLTSTFTFPSAEAGEEFFNIVSGRKPLPAGESAGLIYSRFNHPNAEITEDRLAVLEGAEEGVVCASGMGAITSTFLSVLRPGDVLVHGSPLYGGTETLIRNLLSQFGILSVEFQDGMRADSIEAAIEKAKKLGPIKMIYMETPGNPTNAIYDFELIKQAQEKCERETGVRPLTVCDNTLQGPVFQQAVAHGIDLSVYSLTKYVGGHSDLIAGAVLGGGEAIKAVRGIRNAMGMNLDPHTCWLLSRSLETLTIRMTRAAESGTKVAAWLVDNPYVKTKVLHPEFIDDERYQEIYKRQCSGPGSTFSFVIDGSRQDAFKIINGLSLFKSAVSLGGTESLVSHPASTTHSGIPADVREQGGLTEGLIRISIGLEHPDDLIADLDAAFRGVYR
ncbi:MAG: cystathionine gamma-synthase family protein [Robiginitomaculum sp.]|nr:cystathionine gamma-synthase family protein [Robiginitomaculum sp.]